MISRLYWAARRGLVRLLLEPRGLEDTFQGVRLEDLGLEHPDRVSYAPSGWSSLRKILPRRTVSSSDVFVDFGSGKGRVVLQAARNYRFARVVGVEISAELNRVARENVDRLRHKLKCEEVELVTTDAALYRVPDDMTVAYFANPFVGATFHRVVRSILDSIDRNPRVVRLVYFNPVMHDHLLSVGFEVVKWLERGRGRNILGRATLALYETRPDDRPPGG
jgi:SAM-dependent methyltransferase